MLDRGLASAVALAALALVAVLYFSFKDSVTVTVRRILAGTGVVRETTAPAPEPKPAVKARPKRKAKNTESGAVEPAMPIFEMEVRMPPFPRNADVPAGMSRSEIINQFGMPAFRATWSDFGGLNEKFIYLDRNRSTAVAIRNGQVVSSRTDTAQPLDPWSAGVEGKQ